MKKQQIYLLIISFIFITSCTNNMKEADLILLNGNVYTVDASFNKAEAFAIKDGIILKTGTTEEIEKEFYSDVIIDADKQTVYPGFIDAHCHFTGYGLNLIKSADLTGTISFPQIINILKLHDKKHNPKWLLGRGWDQNDWEVREFPNNKVLSLAFPNKPVMLTRIDGHAAIVNDFALQLAGISIDNKINGGEFGIIDNVLSGLLIDNAIDVVKKLIPMNSDKTIEKALILAQENCFAVGLTSIADAGLEKREVEIIDSLHKAGKLQIGIYAMLSPTQENFDYFVENGIYTTDKLTVRSIKLYADGALGSRGAKLLENYSDDSINSGLYINEPDYYREICALAIKKNYQINTHAIGDAAVRRMLNLYSEFLIEKNDKRWRIEHAQVVHPNDFNLFGQYSIIPSVQATHATSDMYWANERLGTERLKGAYAYRDLLMQNGWIPNGTDFPIENISPIYTFFAAVFRKDLNLFPKDGFQIENAISREEAIRSITIWAAKANFEENKKGSIEKGKNADFIILNTDLMKASEKDIPDTKVISTYINGKKVF